MTKHEDGAEMLRNSVYEMMNRVALMLGMLELGVQLSRSELKTDSDEYLKLNSRVQEFVNKLRETADKLS